MKFISVMMLVLLSGLFIAGCPDKSPNKPSDGNPFEGGKPLEDEKYGSMTLLDKKQMGDHEVSIYVNAFRVGDDKDIKEPAVRIYVKGGSPEKRVVRVWLADSKENKLTTPANGDWNKSGENFLCKPDLKEKGIKPGTYKLWVSVDEALDSWDISVK
jgi:hypothetical protein